MLGNMWASLAMSLVLLPAGSIVAQVKNSSRTLVVNGRTAQAGVVQINGRDYVDLQVLASITNGSLGFQGERIILTLPLSNIGTPAPVPAIPPEPPTEAGFSQDFMKAGIEEISLLREWASPLAYAIQNGYPITEHWVAGYREEAANGLRLASVAAKTEADRKALQLLSNEFESVREWSSKLVEARKSMDTAKYAMSAGALQNDPLSQKIIACGRFLGPMLGSGTFEDNPSCH
jgi:hypothetical protein